MQVEALLACSRGMWGLGVNDCLEQGVGFSWALLRNEFAYLVEGLDIRVVLFNLHTDTTPPQPYHNVTPTHIEPDQNNPCNNSTHKSQAPEDGCINI